MREETEFVKEEKKIIDMANKMKIDVFEDILGIKSLVISEKKLDWESEYDIVMDGHAVNDISIDKYNNLHCEVPDFIPIEYLEKFRRFFNEYFEHRESYYHRSGTGFFIRYFKQHSDELDTEYVKEMCEIDEEDCKDVDSNFRWWLVSNSYSGDIGGNLKRYSKLRVKDFLTKEIIEYGNKYNRGD